MINEIMELVKGYKDDIPDDATVNLLGIGTIDSFDIVNIVSLLESHFHIDIDAEDILPENFQSVEAIEDLVERYVNAK